MIQLDNQTLSGVNPFAAPQTLTFSGIPAEPPEHKVVVRIEFAHVDDADATRTLTVVLNNTGNDEQYDDFDVTVTNRDAGEFEHFSTGSFVLDVSDGLKVAISSDRSGDDNVNIVGFLFSDDVDYRLQGVEATPGATAGSIDQRVTALDVLTEENGNGDLAAILNDTNAVESRLTDARAQVLSDWINDGRLDLLLDAVLVDTGTTIPAQIAALNDLAAGAAMTLTAGERDSIAAALLDLSNGVETGVTVRQYMQRVGAVVAGKISGAGEGTEVFVGLDNSTDRVTVTVDVDGNRTAVSSV